jgi:DNA primase catalytic core
MVENKPDIVDVISNYVRLNKAGKNMVGLCPFHNDTSPSMNVSPEKQIFKCFACNAGGDVIKFVCLYHKISFKEALKELGIDNTVSKGPSRKQIEKEHNELVRKSLTAEMATIDWNDSNKVDNLLLILASARSINDPLWLEVNIAHIARKTGNNVKDIKKRFDRACLQLDKGIPL